MKKKLVVNNKCLICRKKLPKYWLGLSGCSEECDKKLIETILLAGAINTIYNVIEAFLENKK